MKFAKLSYFGPILASFLILTGCSKSTDQTQGYIEGDFRYISAQVGGTLQKLAVHRGETVKKGQLLFQLNSNPQNYQLKQAQAQVGQSQAQLDDLLKGARTPEVDALIAKQEAAQASLTYATKDLSRQKFLRVKGYNSVDNLNLAEQNYRSALADYNAAKANIVNAHLSARTNQILAATAAVQAAKDNRQAMQWQLNQKMQTAPYAALVNNTYFYTAENVPAEQPIVSILRPQDVYAIFYVSAKNRASLKIGDVITIHANNTNQAVKAKINFMSAEAMYTPPLIYSEKNMQDLVFEVHATLLTNHFVLWPGQPVLISLPNGTH